MSVLRKPVCRKCGVAHWMFVACEAAERVNADDEVKASRRRVDVVWRSDLDREFGDRTGAYVRQGNVYWRKRDDDEPEAA